MNGSATLHPSQFDILIIGAGISGINAAYRVQTQLPGLRYAILEARDTIGGTWDLFRYPGIRSDSDLFTFGFPWNPWPNNNPIASGGAICQYMREAAARHGIDSHILFHHRVRAAHWSSADSTWSLDVEVGAGAGADAGADADADARGQRKTLTARFVIWGSGYYNYHEPLDAYIPGLDSFAGTTIHPQFWPEDYDYTDKKIVVIGSGATAITLVPVLAEKAARVTMLQRSPTYILTLPNSSSSLLRFLLPRRLFLQFQRIKWIWLGRIFYLFCQGFPWLSRVILRLLAKWQLPAHVPHDPHFEPRYNPWDQRVCISPDGDFFRCFHSGRADVKTDTIKTVTPSGIQLASGDFLDADVIVTATGLKLQMAGGATFTVDGKPLVPASKFMWHGILLQDLPNAAFVLGYANASWTLGADATARFVCRLIKTMQRRDAVAVVPRLPDGASLQPRSLMPLSSTYLTTASSAVPKAGDRGPWKPRDNYISDNWFAEHGRIDDDLEFVGGGSFKLREKQL
ncbi:hypothetical protein VTO42DRAFT_4928 [Malbranchea cinnamomea]